MPGGSPLFQFDDIMVFLGAPDNHFFKIPRYQKYRLFLEGMAGFSCPYIISLLENFQIMAAIGLTTRTAYQFDFLLWLEWILEEREGIHPLIVEQIITATHEAIANGLLWSNLELEAQERKIRPLVFSEAITQHLNHPDFAQRYIVLSLVKIPPYLEVRLSVEGKPIIWEVTQFDNFRGTAIIRELADQIHFDDHFQTIRLLFNIYQSSS